MGIRIAVTRGAALLGCGLALGGGSYAIAQAPGNDIGITAPSGSIMAFGGTDAPSGWLIADGSEVSRTAYPGLYNAIGTRYGAGNGSTTFNLPDMRGRIAVARGTNASVDAIGESDDVPLGQRTIKHKHGKGSLSINGNGGGHSHALSVFHNDVGKAHCACYGAEGTDGWTGMGQHWMGGGEHGHPASSFTGEVGDTSGPNDGPAYLTVNYLIKA